MSASSRIRVANTGELIEVAAFDPSDPSAALVQNLARLIGSVYRLSRLYRAKSISLYIAYLLERAKTWAAREEEGEVLNVELPTIWTYPSTVELLADVAASKYAGAPARLSKRAELGLNAFLNGAVGHIQRMAPPDLQSLVDVPDNVAAAYVAKLRGEQETLLHNLVLGKLIAAGRLYATTATADPARSVCVRCGNVLELERERCPKCFSAHQGLKYQAYLTAWTGGPLPSEFLVLPIEPVRSILPNPTSPLFEQSAAKQLVMSHFQLKGDPGDFAFVDLDRAASGALERACLLDHGRRLALVPASRLTGLEDAEVHPGLRFSDVCCDFVQLRVSLPGGGGALSHAATPDTTVGSLADAVVARAGLSLADCTLVQGRRALDRAATLAQSGLSTGSEVSLLALPQVAVFVPDAGGIVRMGVGGALSASQLVELLKQRCRLSGEYVLSRGAAFLEPSQAVDPARLKKGEALRLNRLETVQVLLGGQVHTASVSAESTVSELMANLRSRSKASGVLVAQVRGRVVAGATPISELKLGAGERIEAVERTVRAVSVTVSPLAGGRDAAVTILEDQPVSALKALARSKLGLPAGAKVDLVLGERVLGEDLTLLEAGVGDGATVYLMG